MKQVYPVKLIPDGSMYLAEIPDLNLMTQGYSLAEAIEMARDAINLKIVDLEDDKKPIPTPSNIKDLQTTAKEIVTLVDYDPIEYRKKISPASVKKNCTLPSWLNEKAEAEGINFSQTLQEALIEKLAL